MAAPPTQFFKFIRPGFKFNLSIPRSFWTKFKSGRCSKAILRRGCQQWPVDISDEGVFSDGWRKFVWENGVEEFDFIVFKHQGNMVFDFWVFDQSACERQYPNLFVKMEVEEPLTEPDSIHTQRSEKLKKRKRSDYESQKEEKLGRGDHRCFVFKVTPYFIKNPILHVPVKFARSNGLMTEEGIRTQVIINDETRGTWPATILNQKMRIGSSGHEFIAKNQLKIGETCMFELVKHGKVPIFNFYRKKPIKNHTQVKETNSTIKEMGLTPNNHPYFISIFKSRTSKYPMYLPIDFMRSNDLKIGKMILRDDKSRSWEVLLRKHTTRFYLGFGFGAFRVANNLMVGDAFKFEVVKNKTGMTPVVNFFVLGKKPAKNHIQVKETCSTPDDRSSFISVLKPYSIKKSTMYLPNDFSRTNGLKIGKMIIRDDKNRSWEVLAKKKDSGKFYLGCGFRAFRVANKLKVGDAFKFELVKYKGMTPVVNFHVLEGMRMNSRKQAKCLCDEDDHPYFVGKVKSYSLKNSILYLPKEFARKNGLFENGEMVLRNGKGERSWIVEVRNHKNKYSYISQGWKDFRVANGLKEGDRFKLEIVHNIGKKIVAKFYVQNET